MYAAPSPHPGPLPQEEGESYPVQGAIDALALSMRRLRFPLSLRERAGVRGKGIITNDRVETLSAPFAFHDTVCSKLGSLIVRT